MKSTTLLGYRNGRGTLVNRFEKRKGGALKSVERLAENMVKRLGKSEPPFQTDAFEYAKLIGAKVIETDIIPSGMMSVLNGQIIIEVKRSESLERKSYTVCHEVAHVEMRRSTGLFSINSKGRIPNVPAQKKEEQWAQKFAETLLMPREIFFRKASDLPPSMQSVIDLATMFRTSLDATARRISSLKAWKCVMIWGIPEKMVYNDWAMHIHNYESSLSQRLFIPASRLVWWAGDAAKEAYNSNSIVTRKIPIEGRDWRFEGIRHLYGSCVDGVRRRVIALLLPIGAS